MFVPKKYIKVFSIMYRRGRREPVVKWCLEKKKKLNNGDFVALMR